MATTVTAPPQPAVATDRPNWVVGPIADVVFIIGAPVLAFLLFWPIYGKFGIATVLLIFSGANLGHHVPTFIRAYGDKNLMARFRWNMLLAPIIPFMLSMVVIGYLILNRYDIHGVLMLGLVLGVWDPWHFFMQNYGFMRIYDRFNAAPRMLAGRMDFWLLATWFIYIMLGAVNWLPDILHSIHRDAGIPILYLLNSQLYQFVQGAALVASVAMSVIYAGYVFWCVSKGYYVSRNKLLFFAVLNVVMYLTYVPNPVMRSLLPGWTFAAGFATLGMVHVTQYLAIVWKYNRSLALRGTDVRPGLFQRAFSRGGLIVLVVYMVLCFGYGYGLTQLTAASDIKVQSPSQTTSELPDQLRAQQRAHQLEAGTAVFAWKPWFLGVLYSLLFTSTITHYYFDGFIWKVRHKENRQNLEMQVGGERNARQAESSWWDSHGAPGAGQVLLRHALYFGLPISLLMFTGWSVWNDPVKNPMQINTHVKNAEQAHAKGLYYEEQKEMKAAIAGCENLLKIERQMVAIRPTPSDYCLIADLIYRKSNYYVQVVGRAEGKSPRELLEGHRGEVASAIGQLKQALALPDELGHFGHILSSGLTRPDVEVMVEAMEKEVAEIDKALAQMKNQPPAIAK